MVKGKTLKKPAANKTKVAKAKPVKAAKTAHRATSQQAGIVFGTRVLLAIRMPMLLQTHWARASTMSAALLTLSSPDTVRTDAV